MKNPNRYVGRIIRLKQEVFEAVRLRARRQGMTLENCFVVAAVTRELRKLVCYGADFRVVVGIADVALI